MKANKIMMATGLIVGYAYLIVIVFAVGLFLVCLTLLNRGVGIRD